MTSGPPLDYAPPAGSRWTKRVAFGLAFYPVFLVVLLYGIWLSAWAAIGHRPRPTIDDAAAISPAINFAVNALDALLVCAWPAFVIHAGLAGSVYYRSLGGRPPGRLKTVAVAAGISLPWAAAFVMFQADPGDVIKWFGLEAP